MGRGLDAEILAPMWAQCSEKPALFGAQRFETEGERKPYTAVLAG